MKEKIDIRTIVINAIITIILAPIATYYFAPSLVGTSLSISSTEFCRINSNMETQPHFNANYKPRVEVYFDNNNEGFIRVNKIKVRTSEYTSLSETDITLRDDIGGQGNVEEPIYLKSEISSIPNGVYNCEFDNDLGNYSENEYIELESNSSDKFFITLEPEKSGKYEIQIEIDYIYHGKERTVTTESCTFVYMSQSMNDFYN